MFTDIHYNCLIYIQIIETFVVGCISLSGMGRTDLIQAIGPLKETSSLNCLMCQIISTTMSVHLLVCCVVYCVLLKVRDVRTNDDTMITVKLMVFYELRDIETMVTYIHVYMCHISDKHIICLVYTYSMHKTVSNCYT